MVVSLISQTELRYQWGAESALDWTIKFKVQKLTVKKKKKKLTVALPSFVTSKKLISSSVNKFLNLQTGITVLLQAYD